MKEQEQEQEQSYLSWEVGQIINGRKLTAIYARSKNAIVYKFNGDLQAAYKIKKELNSQSRHTCYKYAEYCNKIDSLSTFHMKLEIFDCVNKIFASCLNDPELDGDLIDTKFSQIDALIDKANNTVKKIYATNAKYSVYLDSNNILRTKYTFSEFVNNEQLAECQYKAKQLEILANKHLKGEKLSIALDQIAIAICHSFKLKLIGTKINPDIIFNELEEILNSQFSARIRLSFMSGIMFFSIFFSIALVVLTANIPTMSSYFHAMLLALAGSFVSILQRHNSIRITPSMNAMATAIESLSRICIGLVFGFICVLLANSELALANFKSNQHALLIFSFISGFSERFIPNMLDTVSKKKG